MINLKKSKMGNMKVEKTSIPIKRRNFYYKIVNAKFEEETFLLYKKYLSDIHNKAKIS